MAKDGAEQSLPSSDGQNIPAPAPAPAPHPTTAPATAPVTSNEVRAIFSILHRMCHGESTIGYGCMSCYMYNFFGNLKDPKPLDTLIRSCILRHLTGLYASENRKDSKKADYYIRYLLHLMVAEKTTGFLDERASVILQLCKVLRRMVCRKDSLYVLSLHSLKDLAEKANYVLLDTYKIFYPEWQILPIFDDLANRLLKGLHQCINSPSTKERMDSLISDFRDFKAFSRLYYHAIQEQKENQEDKGNAAPISSVQKSLVNGEEVQPEWSMYLAIFEELNFISRLCPHSRDKFWSVLKSAKLPLGALIVRFAKRRDGYDYQWLLEHNDVTDSDSRMHLAMLMIPGVKESTDAELMKKLVFWSQDLDTDQFRAFQHKSLKDPQVLQDCLCKSCEVIFNPNNPLFLAHPGDSPSFNVNPEFNPEPSHYEFVEFAGKVIALALIHKVRIGVALDGVFLTQLANSSMSYTSNKDLLVSFFAQGVASVFGVSFKELLSFKGLQYEDINQVLCGPSTSSVLSNSSGKRKKEIRIDPPLSHGKEVKKPERNFRNWQRGSMLGSGSFGEVYKGTADPNGFLFAAKKVPLEDTQKVSSIEHTVGSLRQLHHENIVEYFGTKKEEANLYIFHEFVSGGSLDKVHKELILDDARVSCYTQQILKGLKYLHEQNVMHGDIKCANILLNDKGVVQIADFGLAKVIDSENLHNSSRAIPAWSAPEVIDSTRQGGYGLEADIWSLGCTVLEMLTGEYPYCHLEPWTIWYRIGEGIPPDVPDFLSDTSRDFIEKCLQIDPKARPTAAQLLQHPFVKR